jgi:hypothetical protein
VLTHPAAAQQQLAPIEPFQRLRDALGGGRGGAIDTAIGIDRGLDRRRAELQSNEHEQAGDELKHEAHAITPNVW